MHLHDMASGYFTRALFGSRSYGFQAFLLPLIVTLIVFIIFSVAIPRFFTVTNLVNILFQACVLGILTLGQSLVILTAGIDLSNGSIMALCGVVTAGLAVSGWSPYIAILAGLGLGFFLGLLNGFTVTKLRIQPFVVTLGMYSIARALALVYTKGQQIFNLPRELLAFGGTFILGRIPTASIVLVLVTFILWLFIRRTPWGIHVYAIGGNKETARNTGINIDKTLIGVYSIAGLIYAIAALVLLGRTSIGDPNAGMVGNLNSITAAVIGGISLFGGRGSILGALLGVFILTMILNGLTLLSVSALWQLFFTGFLVILAAALQTGFSSRNARSSSQQ